MTTYREIYEKVDYVSDIFVSAICSIDSLKPYWSMVDSEKEQVEQYFFEFLDCKNIKIDNHLITEAKRQFETSPMIPLLEKYRTIKLASTGTSIANAYNKLIKLSPDQKITIVKLSDLGFPVAIQTRFDSIKINPYAQYNESLAIVHKPKRKRLLRENRVLKHDDILIYDGWIDVDVNNLSKVTLKENEHMTVKRSKYNCFDKRYMKELEKAIDAEPIVKII